MFIDTHCHLTDVESLPDVITRANVAGVGALICATANPDDISTTLKITQNNQNIFCTIGIHPEYSSADAAQYLTDTILSNPRIVGIGEIGLDYHYNADTKDAQIKLFRRQLEIANHNKLPVAIHTRDAETDTQQILSEFDIYGVMHCFTGTTNFAKKMLDRGFYFSASGILTFKNADDVRETFATIPNDRIVIETDTPYCAPVPYRGKQCEPFMAIETARVLATIKNIPLSEMENILFENTKRLYPKIKL
ncbi:MAG: TatD family hydrolase [Alphaproteobacteria bacterium]|nr:TatD family hydrolase [Alphaproteobacteria bacterium]